MPSSLEPTARPVASVMFRCGMALNLGAPDRLAFDAASRHPNLPLAVLCDGANGTPHGGAVAQAASHRVLQALEAGNTLSGQLLDAMSQEFDAQWPESGCTLLAFEANDHGVHITGVGDSFAELFAHRRGQWDSEHQLDRHVDDEGHPTQLIGANVPISPHRCERRASTEVTCWAAFLMSDGGGAFLSTADLRDGLLPRGPQTPCDHDLQFCAETLAALAVSRGSHDDVSVLMAWVQQP
ncbi:MAG: protein phosphatase 2C domain-containing protein [Burkholderiaceae bacterium]